MNRNNVEIICLNNVNERLLINTATQNYYSKIEKSCEILREALKHIGLYSKSSWIIKNTHHCTTVSQKWSLDLILRKKQQLFNSFFADQCSLISNSSKLPSKLEYLTQIRFSLITFSTDDIAKIMQNEFRPY